MKSRAVQITRTFFYVLAAFWLAVGIGYIRQGDGRIFFYIIGGMMFASIFVFIALGMFITRKPVYWLGVFALAACVVLTFMDQFGFADLIALILFIIPLVIMLAKRNEFLTSQEAQ
jgi:hypothetical protein